MKALNFLAFGLAGLALGPCWSAAATPLGFSNLKIIQTVTPQVHPAVGEILPERGQVTLALNIDASGNLADYMLLNYTEKLFADAAIEALRRWKFQPATQDGVPLDIITTLTFNFELNGQVVSISGPGMFDGFIRHAFGDRTVQCVYMARDVDVSPLPSVVVAPIPVQAPGKSAAGVSVTFFIDETGRPRMAAVDSKEDRLLAAAALQAIEQWRFVPARRRGVPVAVKACQQFNFAPRVAIDN